MTRPNSSTSSFTSGTRNSWTACLVFVAVVLALVPPARLHAAIVALGETTVLTTTDSGNGGLLVAQQATLSQAAVLQSMSFYVVTAAGSVRLGIYGATGPNGGPGSKIAETAQITPVVGWNTANVTTQPSLPAGTYWLAYFASSSSLAFRNTPTGKAAWYGLAFGPLPVTFSTAPASGAVHWSLYASLNTAPDTTAPTTPTNVVATATSSSQVNLSWTASTDGVGVAGYKIFRNGAQVGTSVTTSYSDTGLAAGTSYVYTVSAFDAAANQSGLSVPASATTLAVPFNFSLTTGGSKSVAASGSVSNTVTAALLSGTSNAVSFSASGLPSGAAGSFSPASCSPSCPTTMTITTLSTTPAGTSTVTVTATGGSVTHTTSFALTATAASDTTPPVVSLTVPAANTTLAGTAAAVSASASDASGVAGVQFLLDGASLGAEVTISPYSVTWDTTTASNGSHQLSARARDAAGNISTATSIPVVVDNQAPIGSVAINGGAAATNSRNVTLTLAATDALSPVTQMRFSNTGSSYSTAETYATTKAWTLSTGSGTETVYVQFQDAAGNWSTATTDTIVVDTTAPTVSAVAATNITNGGATVNWTTNEPATSRVEYGTTTAYGQSTTLDSTLATAHSVGLTALAAQTTYNYRVRSIDAAGNERVGSNASFRTLAGPDVTPPTVPTNVVATAASSSQISVNWTAATDNVAVSGYNVFRNGIQIASPSATSYQDSGLTPSTPYTYTIAARDAAGNVSAQSSPASATTQATPDTVPPTAPAGVGATGVSVSGISLTWTASSDNVSVTGYKIFRDGGQVGTSVTTAYVDTGLSPSSAHVYTVSAYDAAGNQSSPSSPASGTTLADTTGPAVPAQPTVLSKSSSVVNLTWSASSDDVGVTGYGVIRDGILVATVPTLNYSDTTVSAGATYTYAVTARDAAGNVSAPSSAVSVTTPLPDTTPPSVPTQLQSSNVTATSVTVSWTASSDDVAVTGYKIFRDGALIASTSQASYGDTGLSAATAYSYTVAAFDGSGNTSSQSLPLVVTTSVGNGQTPTLVQHVSSSANPVGLGISGNAFNIPLPNAVGAGNCLILGMSYLSGRAVTITDSNGNVWPSTAAATANAGPGYYVASVWVLPNAHAGATTVTVTFDAPVIPFQYTISEFFNVATVSPVNGTSATPTQAGASAITGSFTPGNNDAGGGNLIWSYFAIAASANGNPSRFVPGSNFRLLDADIAWNTNQGFPHASEYSVQAVSAAINPAMTATGDSGNAYNGVSVALKAAPAGTPPPSGIRIVRILHMTSNVPPTTTWPLQVPSLGNLIVLATNENDIINVTSVTDSHSNAYAKAEPDPSEPQFWFAGNATTGDDLLVSLHLSGTSATATVVAYDITGAAASPLDVVAGTPITNISGGSSITNAPSITPTTPNGLVIASMDIGQGPGLAAISPSGATWDLVTFAGEIDLDLLENADAKAHLYYSSTAAQNWSWTVTPISNNSYSALAVAFKAAPAQAP